MQIRKRYSFCIVVFVFDLIKRLEAAEDTFIDTTLNSEPPAADDPNEGSGRSVQEYYAPPNQVYSLPENNGYGYIPPQSQIYSQLPPQRYPIPYGGVYQHYPFNGGYYPGYGAFPQKPIGLNYLQAYDAYYGGTQHRYK